MALTGEPGVTDADLARAARDRAARANVPWPYPVPDEILARIGYARWAAALRDARLAIAGDDRELRHPDRSTTDELRLLRDRPPHW